VTTPIDDLRVLDLTDNVAGAYCTKLLVDAGAEVVKIEKAGGDPLRRRPGLFAYLCAGKAIAGGPPATWLDWADVIVQTEPRVTGDRVVTITPFGTTGPWAGRPASEFTLQALCGSMGFRGFPDGPPVAVGGELGSYAAGTFAAVAVLASLSRPAAHYDVSMLEAMVLTMQGYEWLHASLMGLTRFNRSIEVPSIEPAKDGWVGMTMVTGQQWQDFAAMVGQPKLAEDPDLCNQLGRWPRRQEVYDLIHPWLADRTVAEVVETASLYRVPMAPLGNGATVRSMDHFAERGVFVENPAGFEQPRPPWLMSGCAPAPLRPCDTPAVHGPSRGEPTSMRSASSISPPSGPDLRRLSSSPRSVPTW
jgi:crotonobetainyl-CoA:carnitine CoA-transferase CaiB-like acyl-CoA transferase